MAAAANNIAVVPGMAPLVGEKERELYLSIRMGDTDRIHAILQPGVRLDMVDEDGNNFFHYLMQTNTLSIPVRVDLIQMGRALILPPLLPGIINHRNQMGLSPLHMGIRFLQKPAEMAIMDALMEAGADVNQPTRDEELTPMMLTVGTPLPCMKILALLRHGADMSAVDKKGRTILHYAAIYQDRDVMMCVTHPSLKKNPMHWAKQGVPGSSLPLYFKNTNGKSVFNHLKDIPDRIKRDQMTTRLRTAMGRLITPKAPLKPDAGNVEEKKEQAAFVPSVASAASVEPGHLPFSQPLSAAAAPFVPAAHRVPVPSGNDTAAAMMRMMRGQGRSPMGRRPTGRSPMSRRKSMKRKSHTRRRLLKRKLRRSVRVSR